MLFSPDCRARKTVSSDINNSKHPRLSLVNFFLSGIDLSTAAHSKIICIMSITGPSDACRQSFDGWINKINITRGWPSVTA